MTFNLTAARHRQHAALATGAMQAITQRAITEPADYRLGEVSASLRTLSTLRDEAAHQVAREAALDALTAHLDALPDDPAFERPAPIEWR